MTTDTTHKCPGPGCERRVPSHMLACAPHWYQVPKDIRDEVWSAWKALQREQPDPITAEERHGLAMRTAIEAMRAIPRRWRRHEMAGELTDEKLGAMVMAGIGAFPHGSVTPFSAQDIGACALMVGDLRNEVASLRTVLNDLLLTRQAHREAYAEEMRLADTFHHFENVEGLAEADDRTAEAEKAHEEAWDRACSLLAGEEKP